MKPTRASINFSSWALVPPCPLSAPIFGKTFRGVYRIAPNSVSRGIFNFSPPKKKHPFSRENNTRGARNALRVVVASVHVGNVRLHHVLDKLLEGDLRHPAELLLCLGAVTLNGDKRTIGKTDNINTSYLPPQTHTVKLALDGSRRPGRDTRMKGQDKAHEGQTEMVQWRNARTRWHTHTLEV